MNIQTRRLRTIEQLSAFIEGGMSGLATREALRRQHEVFGDDRFVRLATVANGHVYNLRGSRTYVAARKVRLKTQAAPVGIGLRRAPEPNEQAGLRSGQTRSTRVAETARRACT